MRMRKMQVIHRVQDWQHQRKIWAKDKRIGFVPTMGQLHAGHISLCKQSQAENDITVVSIFVNPTQFNQKTDYLHYPRNLEADLSLLEANQIDYCLVPTEAEIYPNGYQHRIHALAAENTLEGAHRPGHFDGVLTVMMKLFQLLKPHNAYFGEKDYEQYSLIQEMVKDFFLDVSIHLCPTIREPSQLAYSSRNARLSLHDKQKADLFAKLFHQTKPLAMILADLKAAEIEVEYLEARHNRRFIAVMIGGVRLIDNDEVQP